MAEKKKKKRTKKKKTVKKVTEKQVSLEHAEKNDAVVNDVVKEIPVQSDENEGYPVEISIPHHVQVWHWLWPLLRAVVLMSFVLVLGVLAIYYGFERFYQDKTLPNTFVGSVPVGGLSYAEAQNVLAENFAALQQNTLTFIVDNTSYVVPFDDVGINYDFEKVMNTLHDRKPHDVWGSLLLSTHIPSGLEVNVSMLQDGLQRAVPSIAVPPKNASVYLAQDSKNKPYFAVVPAEAHITADFSKIAQTLTAMLEQGKILPLFVHTYEGQPDIADEDAYNAIQESEVWLQNTVTLAYANQDKKVHVEIAPAKDWQWLEFVPHNGKLVVSLNSAKWQDTMTKTILPAIEQNKEDVTVSMPTGKSKYATVSGQLKDGFKVDSAQSKALVESAFATPKINTDKNGAQQSRAQEVTLVVNFEPARFISSDGQDLGLKDLLGVGHSRFEGSSSARIYNVKKGLGIYNNVVLAPGEKLAFNSLLGDVTVKAGWKEELVIKEGGNKTVPEAGGGLCQVSTTVYRALIESGLKVLERRAHSYLVSYYVGDDDPMAGIDATIYPGSQDLVFVNDTEHYILLQTDTSGVDAYVRIYGTSDGRKVSLEGPAKSNWVDAGKPILQASSALPPGEVKITKKAHQGRTIKWVQTIIRGDGKEEKHDIISVYKAIPAEGIIGVASANASNASGPITL